MATMKMSGCMALVSRMSQSDQDALLARLDQYQADGIPAERAQIMAASDMLAELQGERSQIMSAIAEQFPDLLTVEEAAPAQASKRQTDTPEFKRWFGDSKVVDENGEPRVMYHGTAVSNIGVFKGNRGVAAHFAFDPEFANGFAEQANEAEQEKLADGEEDIGDGGQVYAAYLRASNIFDARNPEHLRAAGIEDVEDYTTLEGNVREIKAAGFDSYYDFENSVDDPPTGIAVFRPEQIKSAIGNSGAFDPANPDIRFSRRERTPLGFYSALADSIDGIKTNSAPAQGWKDAIKGLVNKGAVKSDEVEWSGINDWLDLQQGKVTREAVAQYLRDGGVQVEEVVLGDGKSARSNYGVAFLDDDNVAVVDGDSIVQSGFADAEEAEAWIDSQPDVAGKTKYGQYTLPGGENYREVLLTLPVSGERQRLLDRAQEARQALRSALDADVSNEEVARLRKEFDEANAQLESSKPYKSSHWDQPNVIAHIRVNDRTDADGNRVLFVEELQSDWGQEGKKRGFVGQLSKEALELRELDKIPDSQLTDAQRERGQELLQIVRQQGEQDTRQTAVPNAPFVTKTEGWLNLALKRIVTMAAEGGYDKVAFTTGEQNAERFSLDKRVERIIYTKRNDGLYDVNATTSGQNVMTENGIGLDRVEDLLGKEIAERIAAGVGDPWAPKFNLTNSDYSNTKSLTGDNLKVEAKGMRAFYDSIVPLAVKKLLPKVGGGQMGQVGVLVEAGSTDPQHDYFFDARTNEYVVDRVDDNGETEVGRFADRETAAAEVDRLNKASATPRMQPGFDVTDAMREKVAEGLPLFSRRQRDSWMLGRDEVGRVNFGPGAKAYDLAAGLANKVLSKLAMAPASDELSRAIRNMKVEVDKAQNLTADVAVKLNELSKDEREMISDVIEGELKAGVTPPPRVLAIAASMQQIMSDQSAELVRLGMLSKDAANRWDMKYLPRFYESKLGDEAKAWAKAAKSLLGRKGMMQGIGGQSLKSRGMYETIDASELKQWIADGWEQRDPDFDPKNDTETVVWRDFTREEREKMGEIRDAMFRFVMGYMRSQRDIALGRLYEGLAANYASNKPKDGYVQVPASKIEGTGTTDYNGVPRYGKLAGKYVPKEIMDHLAAQDESTMSGIFKIYRAGLSKWKEGKTVLNPVSHANNVISNITMAHFAGVSYWDAHKYAGAVKDLVTKDPMVQEANDIGVFGGTFNQSEIVQSMPPQLRQLAGMSESRISRIGEGLWDILAFTVSWNGKKYGVRPVAQWAYENEDLFFRYLVYRDARKRGMAPEDAREFSQQYIFTYDDLPKGAKAVRDFGMPFFSYTYKVTPVLARTALEYPWRYAAPAGALWAANAMMYAIAASLGGDDDEWWGKAIYRYATDEEFRKRARDLETEERKKLPEWMKGASTTLATPKAIRLGMDEVTGMPLFLDVSKIFPGGDLVEANNNAGGLPVPNAIMPSNPVLTTALAMLGNRDMFTGKDVVDRKNDTNAEAAEKRAAWMWRQLTPAIAIGNYHFDRAMDATASVTGKPITVSVGDVSKSWTGVGKDELPVQPGYLALQTIGIKVRPYNLELSERIDQAKQSGLVRELEQKIRNLNRLESRGAISTEAADIERDRQREKIDRVREGLTVDGEER